MVSNSKIFLLILKMEQVSIFLVSILLFSGTTVAAECETGWLAYKDELCIKVFPTDTIEYDEAQALCSSQGTQLSNASLVMVKDSEMQELLADYTADVYDYVWIGARYDNQTAEFRWIDGEPLTYTNWEDGYPRNNAASDACVELRPINAKSSTASEGKWADAPCQRRNLAMCQKVLSWTLQDAINEIIKIRRQLDDVSSKVVPIGSIYIEYYNQPSPPSLWPSLTWQDISNTYAGLFFRASGGDSAGWGVTQSECAPRITEINGTSILSQQQELKLSLPADGWSGSVHAGVHDAAAAHTHYEGIKFNTTGCEVRPKNQAIRVWKRTG